MENASKALLMAGGILIGILILSLMTTLFVSSKQLSTSYDNTKNEEAIQRFNVNFTKYLGHDLTIHQVITIYNFAIQNGFEETDILRPVSFSFSSSQINTDLNKSNEKLSDLSGSYYNVEKIYELIIEEYNQETGCVSKIKFIRPTYEFKCYKKDNLGNIRIDYMN